MKNLMGAFFKVGEVRTHPNPPVTPATVMDMSMRLIDVIDQSVGDRDHLATSWHDQDVATCLHLNGFVCEPHRLLIDLIDYS